MKQERVIRALAPLVGNEVVINGKIHATIMALHMPGEVPAGIAIRPHDIFVQTGLCDDQPAGYWIDCGKIMLITGQGDRRVSLVHSDGAITFERNGQ